MFLFVIGNAVNNKFVSQFLSHAALAVAVYSVYRILTFEPIIPVSSQIEERLLSVILTNARSFPALLAGISALQFVGLLLLIRNRLRTNEEQTNEIQ